MARQSATLKRILFSTQTQQERKAKPSSQAGTQDHAARMTITTTKPTLRTRHNHDLLPNHQARDGPHPSRSCPLGRQHAWTYHVTPPTAKSLTGPQANPPTFLLFTPCQDLFTLPNRVLTLPRTVQTAKSPLHHPAKTPPMPKHAPAQVQTPPHTPRLDLPNTGHVPYT